MCLPNFIPNHLFFGGLPALHMDRFVVNIGGISLSGATFRARDCWWIQALVGSRVVLQFLGESNEFERFLIGSGSNLQSDIMFS